MVIHGIGTDVIHILRVAKCFERFEKRFLIRAFHLKERERFADLLQNDQTRAHAYLAGR